MIFKTFHRRGRKPRREVIAPVGGRLYTEHVDGIVKLYALDGLTIEDIARAYKLESSAGVGKICRRAARYHQGKGTPQDGKYFATAIRYAEALRLLALKPELDYRAVGREAGLKPQVVRAIAKRNGLERSTRREGL